jgi:ribose transport system permease protein
VLILALAATIPLRTGLFDFSLAAEMIFSSSLVALISTHTHMNTALVCVIAVAAAAAVGFINAAISVGFDVDCFVVTLGMSSILGGVAYAFSSGEVVGNLPGSLETFSRAQILGLPGAVFYGWALAVLLWVVYEFTPFGKNLLYAGGNPSAAAMAGVPVRRVRIAALVLAGALAGFAGVILAGTLGAVDPTSASSYLLQPYTAAFLGVAAIQLGRFNVGGTMVAIYLLATGETGLELLGVPSWVADVFNGAILIITIVFGKIVSQLQTD